MALEQVVALSLKALPPSCTCLWVALSGGRDSVALLTATARALARHCPDIQLRVVHVNHHLQSAATSFEQFCTLYCDRLQVPLVVQHVEVDPRDGGLEQSARHARYAAFTELLDTTDVLWLAHHADDQAETLLLRLMRGSGVKGLSAMPAVRALGKGMLMRPLLQLPQSALIDYAVQQGLEWCEDPSNAELHQDRNYLRHQVLPALQARWPEAISAICCTANHMRASDDAMSVWADEWWATHAQQTRVPVAALRAVSIAQQQLLVRRALERQGLPMPPKARLATLLSQLSAERGEVTWPEVAARIWRRHLYLEQAEPSAALPEDLPARWQLAPSQGTATSLEMRPRRGGETLYVNGCHRGLKALFQRYEIPPWRRETFCVVVSAGIPVALLSMHYAILADGWTAEQSQGTVLTS